MTEPLQEDREAGSRPDMAGQALEAVQLLRLAAAQLEAARADSNRDFETLSTLLADLQRDYNYRNTGPGGSAHPARPICSFGRTLLEALGTLQFHDLLRQRLEQVSTLLSIAEGRVGSGEDATARPDFAEIMSEIRHSYISERQRSVHDAIFPGPDRGSQASLPVIDLF